MTTIISYILIGLGLLIMLVGIVALFTFENFYSRLLISSKIDTVGTMTIIFGFIVSHGFSFFSAKLVLLLVIILIRNPIIAHILANSAYRTGLRIDKDSEKDYINVSR